MLDITIYILKLITKINSSLINDLFKNLFDFPIQAAKFSWYTNTSTDAHTEILLNDCHTRYWLCSNKCVQITGKSLSFISICHVWATVPDVGDTVLRFRVWIWAFFFFFMTCNWLSHWQPRPITWNTNHLPKDCTVRVIPPKQPVIKNYSM